RGNHRAFDYCSRHWPLDRGNASPVRSRTAGCLAGARLWSAQRFRKNFWQTKTSDAETIAKTWRKMAAVSLGRGVVFLACARCSKEDESFRLDARNDGFPAVEVHQIAGAEAALLNGLAYRYQSNTRCNKKRADR